MCFHSARQSSLLRFLRFLQELRTSAFLRSLFRGVFLTPHSSRGRFSFLILFPSDCIQFAAKTILCDLIFDAFVKLQQVRLPGLWFLGRIGTVVFESKRENPMTSGPGLTFPFLLCLLSLDHVTVACRLLAGAEWPASRVGISAIELVLRGLSTGDLALCLHPRVV